MLSAMMTGLFYCLSVVGHDYRVVWIADRHIELVV